jgi:ATP-dependent HslUV protease subunit HslV
VRSTTVLAVVRGGRIAMAADGQVTVGNAVMKHGAQKVRRSQQGRALYGFAGGAADALALSERLEAKLLVGDPDAVLLVSGSGDVIEPDDGIVAIGSGGSFALAAARALARHTDRDAETIAREALGIAAEICIYTNERIQVLALP